MNLIFKLGALIVLTIGLTQKARGQSLTLKGQWTPPAAELAARVLVQGNVAYVMTDRGVLKIFDVTNEQSPTLTGQVALTTASASARGYQIAVSGNYAYAAAGLLGILNSRDSDVYVVDISNPAVPVVVRELETASAVLSVKVAGTRLYAGGSSGLQIWDLATPSDPQLLGTFPTSASVQQVEVRGDIAYLAALGEGFITVDISNPASPSRIGGFALPQTEAWDFQLQGNFAYMSLYYLNGGSTLRILDITNPVTPTSVYNSPARISPQLHDSITVSGNTLVFGSTSTGGLLVFDVSVPSQPNVLPSIGNPGAAKAGDVSAVGNRLYVANYSAGLNIYDLQSPASVKRVGAYPMGLGLTSVAISGNYAYVADAFAGVIVFNIQDPANPTKVRSFIPLHNPTDVVLSGGTLVVHDRNWFQIYDLSDPANPQARGSLTNGVIDLTVSGNYIYAIAGAGLQAIDISNPLTPTIVLDLSTPASGKIAAIGTGVYIASVDGFIRAYDLSVLANGRQVKEAAYRANDLAVAGNFLYAAGDGGMRIFDGSSAAQFHQVTSYNSAATALVGVGDDRVFVTHNNFDLTASSLELVDTTELTFPRLAAGPVALTPIRDMVARGSLSYLAFEGRFAIYDSTLAPQPARPTLQIIQDGQTVILRWPDEFADFKLYSTSDFLQPWNLVTLTPGHEGNNQSYTNKFPVGTALFYKLVK